MSDKENWMWWVGHDDERFHTECDTREEAVRIASEEQDGGHIVEAMKPANINISGYFDGELFFENAEEQSYETHGDPDGDFITFEVSHEQALDLQATVRATMDKWQEENGLVFTGFQFAATRNHEYIPPKDDES